MKLGHDQLEVGVRVLLTVDREEHHIFDDGLRHEHSVEGVAMQRRQPGGKLGVGEGDWKLGEVEATHLLRDWFDEAELPLTLFDSQFPRGDGADEHYVPEVGRDLQMLCR